MKDNTASKLAQMLEIEDSWRYSIALERNLWRITLTRSYFTLIPNFPL